MTLESAYERWELVFFKNWKKIVFQALVAFGLKKKFPTNKKNRFLWKVDFRPKKHLEIVFATSNAKKWIFWIILRISCPGNFFHRTFSFFSKRVWKFGFFVFSQIWPNLRKNEKSKFSSALTEKTKSPMKKIPRAQNTQNYPKN